MRAELKSLLAVGDSPEGVEHYAPEDPADFCIALQAFVGATDDALSDSFDVLVCTPAWLAKNFDSPRLRQAQPRAWTWQRRGIEFGRQFILMERWNYALLYETLSRLCSSVEGPDWGTVASRIDHYLPWEYDYRYERHLEAVAGEYPFPPKADD
jgi:hypothetical protein